MAAASKRRTRKGAGRPRKSDRPAPRKARAAALDLRRTPVQSRGRKTFNKILDTTADLLESVGVDVLTTNLIARTAAVNVATLYQYFPNKQAVLLSLFERQSAARLELAERYIKGLATAPDWRKHLRELVRSVAKSRTTTRGVMALRQAMRSSPDLQAHDREHWRKLAATMTGELSKVGVRGANATVIGQAAIETMAALFDFWTLESGGRDPKIVDQIEAVLAGYLGPYFERGRKR